MRFLKFVFKLILGSVLLAGCGVEERPYRIGVVNPLPIMESVLEGFKLALSETGYAEGEEIIYVYDGPIEDKGLLTQTANRWVADEEVDMLLAFSTVATQIAKEAVEGTDIPVVFVPVTDPLSNDFVETLDRPGGNLTGIMNGGSEAKRLEWTQTLDPSIESLFIAYNPTDGSAANALRTTEETAVKLGITLITQQVHNDEDVREAIDTMPPNIDGIFMLPDIITISRTSWFLEEALKRKIILTGLTNTDVESGALLAFGLSFLDAGRQAASLARQIIEGTPVSELPVEPAEFFLFLNLDTAEKIGLVIPDPIVDQADRVIP